jgi:hypothetical protein
MKTTMDLPDELLIAAKKRAAELRRPLRSLVEEGLRIRLAMRDGRKPATSRKIRWVCVKGGLPPGMEVADRVKMHDWLGGNS